MFNNFISNVSSKISYINSLTTVDILPGAISGGIFGRELLIKNLSLDTSDKDSALKLGAKTVANLVIRSSSIAFSPYNPISLPYFNLVTNPLMAIGKGYQAYSLYTQGKEENDLVLIDEAKEKTLEVAKHVALSVFDYWTLGLLNTSKVFDVVASIYVAAGVAMDVSKSSKNMHVKLFDDPNYTLPDDDDSDDEDSDSLSIYSEGSSSEEEEVGRRASCGADDESDEEDFDYDDGEIGLPEDDYLSEEVSSSDEEREPSLFETPYLPPSIPPRSAADSLKSPIGEHERSFIAAVEVDDECGDERTSGPMKLRDNFALRRPSRFFSPSP